MWNLSPLGSLIGHRVRKILEDFDKLEPNPTRNNWASKCPASKVQYDKEAQKLGSNKQWDRIGVITDEKMFILSKRSMNTHLLYGNKILFHM